MCRVVWNLYVSHDAAFFALVRKDSQCEQEYLVKQGIEIKSLDTEKFYGSFDIATNLFQKVKIPLARPWEKMTVVM